MGEGQFNHYGAGDNRVLKTAVDAQGLERHAVYIFPSLELRGTDFDTAAPGDFTRDASTEVGYLFANGVRLARLVNEPLATSPDPEVGGLHVFFELGDHLGSHSLALDKATSELVERSTYQAYGGAESSYRPEKWGAFREDYRFTGKEEDVEVGLVYFGKRYLNVHLQRWISPDPLTIHGLGGDPNCYAYVSGQALAAIDPLGLDALGEKTDAAVQQAAETGTVTPYEEIEAAPQPVQMCFKDEKEREDAIQQQGDAAIAYEMRQEDYYARVGAVIPTAEGPPPPTVNEKMATVTQSFVGAATWGATGSEEAAAVAAILDPTPYIAQKGSANPAVRLPVAAQPGRVTPRPAPKLRAAPKRIEPGGSKKQELKLAEDIARLRGEKGQATHFRGPKSGTQAGIDGWINSSPVSFKETDGGLSAILRHSSQAEAKAKNANFGGVHLFIRAKNVKADAVADFGAKGPLAQIPSQGTIRSITIITGDGVVTFGKPLD